MYDNRLNVCDVQQIAEDRWKSAPVVWATTNAQCFC